MSKIFSFETGKPVEDSKENPEAYKAKVVAAYDLEVIKAKGPYRDGTLERRQEILDNNWIESQFHDKVGIRTRSQIFLAFCDEAVCKRLQNLSEKLERKDLLLKFDGDSYSICKLKTGELVSAERMTLEQAEVFTEELYKESAEKIQIAYANGDLPDIPWVEYFAKEAIVRAGIDCEWVIIASYRESGSIYIVTDKQKEQKLYTLDILGAQVHEDERKSIGIEYYLAYNPLASDPKELFHMEGIIEIPSEFINE